MVLNLGAMLEKYLDQYWAWYMDLYVDNMLAWGSKVNNCFYKDLIIAHNYV